MKTVLLVDDEELILSFLKVHFESRDFQVTLAKENPPTLSYSIWKCR